MPALRRLAGAYMEQPADREDLFQEIAVALWQAIPRFRGESSERTQQVAPGEAAIQRVVASIPVKRLRQAGVLDLLLNLANETDRAVAAETMEKNIADMDLDDLVNAAFLDDD